MKYCLLISCLCLLGCATQSIDVRTTSTNELLDRRAEINRKIRDDDFGFFIGLIRWISHANEEKNSLRERAAINAELERRNISIQDISRGRSTANWE